ncbi:MAG: hypothetical protein K8S27_11585 [Candidatus Omnitrophica bacterium]|nr:hypothetical protein [Candidatus Omnitrophota bacterium]
MAKSDQDIPKVSLSNTKKEMMDAFKKMKKALEEKDETELKPEKKIEEKRTQEVTKVADSLSSERVSTDINNLKLEIGKALSQVSEKLEEQTQKYQKVQEAIDVKNKELQEIYDIEKSAFALAALIESQKQKKLEFDEEISGLRKELEGRIEKTKFLWDKEQKEYDETLKERNAQEKKERERKKEEYTYVFEREKQLAENKYKDEVNKQTKDLFLKKEEFDKKIAEQNKVIKEREVFVAEREKRLDDLQKEVDSFPKRMEAAVNKAVDETTARLKEEANKNEMLLKKESDGESGILKTKIDSLEKIAADQNKQIANLTVQLEKAYGKVQDIAVKAVDGSAKAKAFNDFSRHFTERGNKQSQE